jgi:hypothetical protein
MHGSAVMWFDTAGCLKTSDFTTNTLWGNVNKVAFNNAAGGWFQGVQSYATGAPPGAPD